MQSSFKVCVSATQKYQNQPLIDEQDIVSG